MDSASAFWEEINRLYSVVVQVAEDGQIIRASELFARRCLAASEDASTPAPSFFDMFQFKRPTTFGGTFEEAKAAGSALFLGFSEQQEFAIRGQLMDYSRHGLEGLCFVGVPWLWWMQNQLDDTGLHFG